MNILALQVYCPRYGTLELILEPDDPKAKQFIVESVSLDDCVLFPGSKVQSLQLSTAAFLGHYRNKLHLILS